MIWLTRKDKPADLYQTREDNRAFYRDMFRIALPVALQNIISYSVNLTDTIMLGKLGEIALSAASLANQVFFVFTAVCTGVSGGCSGAGQSVLGKAGCLFYTEGDDHCTEDYGAGFGSLYRTGTAFSPGADADLQQ